MNDDDELQAVGEIQPPARSLTMTGWVSYRIDDPDAFPMFWPDYSGRRADRPTVQPGWDARRVTITIDLP